MSTSARNVFISHYNKDEEHISRLRELIGDKQGVVLRNHSIDSTKPNNAKNEEYIKSLLRERIGNSGTVVVLIGPKTHTRWWINWEIEQAYKQGKRIVGVYTSGASESDIPENFENYGDALVGWQSERVLGAIDGEINNMEKPDGSQRDVRWTGGGAVC